MVLGVSEQSQFLGIRCSAWMRRASCVQQTLAGCAEALGSCPQHQSDSRLLPREDPVLMGSHIHCLAVCRGRKSWGCHRPGRTPVVDPSLLWDLTGCSDTHGPPAVWVFRGG